MPDLQVTAAAADFIDLALAGGRLQEGEALQSAVVLSIFSDARARADDPLPHRALSRRGWWGDSLAPQSGDRFGSRLWLLANEKQTAETLNRARQYAEEALAWLKEDRIAASVTVRARWVRPNQKDSGVLGLEIDILRPAGALVALRYDYAWAERASRESA